MSLLLEKLKIEQEKKALSKNVIGTVKQRHVEKFHENADNHRHELNAQLKNFDEETAAIKKQRERIRNQVKEVKKHYQFLKQQAVKEMRYSSSANRQYTKLSRANSRGGVVLDNPMDSPRQKPSPPREAEPEEQPAQETTES